MSRVVSYLVRFVVMLFGYGVACLAASAFLAILMLGAFGFSAEEVRWMGDATLLVTVPLRSTLPLTEDSRIDASGISV